MEAKRKEEEEGPEDDEQESSSEVEEMDDEFKREEEMGYAQGLNRPPLFDQYNGYGKTLRGVNNWKVHEKKYGTLDFHKLAQDNVITVSRNNKGQVIPLTGYSVDFENQRPKGRQVQYGQHIATNNPEELDDELNGIGRKIRITKAGIISIWEG